MVRLGTCSSVHSVISQLQNINKFLRLLEGSSKQRVKRRKIKVNTTRSAPGYLVGAGWATWGRLLLSWTPAGSSKLRFAWCPCHLAVRLGVSTMTGLSTCQCVSQAHIDAVVHGLNITHATIDFVEYSAFTPGAIYPVDYGVSCDAHDLGKVPYCLSQQCTSMDGEVVLDWCANEWCWVDPLNCTGAKVVIPDNITSGSYFQGAGFAYSYSTCGNDDVFSTFYKAKVLDPSPPPPSSPPPTAPPPPWWSNPCASGYEQMAPSGDCRECSPGSFQDDSVVGAQVCLPCPVGTVQPNAGSTQCVSCPNVGVNCDNRAAIEVYGGYYWPELLANGSMNNSLISVWPCPSPATCLGGLSAGDESCTAGHEGALCGLCKAGFYRSSGQQCEICSEGWMGEESAARSQGSDAQPASFVRPVRELFAASAGLLVICVAVVVLIGLYLLCTDVKASRWTCRGRAHGGDGCQALQPVKSCIRALSHAITRHATTLNAMFKILLGYSQALGVIGSFVNIKWPDFFQLFLQTLARVASPFGEALDSVPYECSVGGRVSFYIELAGYLALPIVLLIVLLLLAAAIVPFTSRCTGEAVSTRLKAFVNWPQLWDVMIWMVTATARTTARTSAPGIYHNLM